MESGKVRLADAEVRSTMTSQTSDAKVTQKKAEARGQVEKRIVFVF